METEESAPAKASGRVKSQQMSCDKCGKLCTMNRWGVCGPCRKNKVCERCGAPFEFRGKKGETLWSNRTCKPCRNAPRTA